MTSSKADLSKAYIGKTAKVNPVDDSQWKVDNDPQLRKKAAQRRIILTWTWGVVWREAGRLVWLGVRAALSKRTVCPFVAESDFLNIQTSPKDTDV